MELSLGFISVKKGVGLKSGFPVGSLRMDMAQGQLFARSKGIQSFAARDGVQPR